MSWREDLFARRTLGVRLGLEAVAAADRALGSPGEGLPTVHVLGTNGKGSTAAMTAHALRRAGRRVGLYTSPHLHRLGERVNIDGTAVPDSVLEHATRRVLAVEDPARRLSFFEVVTLAALLAFADAGVEVLVLEAGLGGRLDATRVRTSCVTAFSRIALDHQQLLGPTLVDIATEKADVMHAGALAFTVAQDDAAAQVLERTARTRGVVLLRIEPLPRAPLAGAHQRHNAALALASAQAIDGRVDATDLEGVSWPGRLETIAGGGGRFVLDVAHNPDGIAALVAHCAAAPPDVVVFGCVADKDAGAMRAQLERLQRPILWVPPAHPDAGALAPPGEPIGGPDDPLLWDRLAPLLGRGGTVLVCGSHFLVGPVRARLLALAPAEQDAAPMLDPLPRG